MTLHNIACQKTGPLDLFITKRFYNLLSQHNEQLFTVTQNKVIKIKYFLPSIIELVLLLQNLIEA